MTLARWIGIAAVLVSHVALATTGSEPLQNVQHRPWRPDAPGVEVPLWPKDLAIAQSEYPGPEVFGTANGVIAGKPIQIVEHVTRPTMAIYPAKGTNTGAALLVFPGGGYRILAIDLEGTEICDRATAKGMTCAVLKYRVPGSGPYWNEDCNCRRDPKEPMALQDAQRAMGLLRQRAATFHFDPNKVGVVGFSAGGRMVADINPFYHLIEIARAPLLGTVPDMKHYVIVLAITAVNLGFAFLFFVRFRNRVAYWV